MGADDEKISHASHVYSGTSSDEKVLNRAGDMAALAVIRSLSIEDLSSPEKARQTLLILNLAFAAPQLIAANTNRRPTAAMLLLDHLSNTDYRQHVNEIENTRNEVQHNTITGHPYEVVTLKGEPLPDVEHTQWVASVLRWTYDIRPGMTRNDMLRVFTTEGGLSTGTRRTYVLKGCPYIKVDVEFKAVGRPERDNEGRVTLEGQELTGRKRRTKHPYKKRKKERKTYLTLTGLLMEGTGAEIILRFSLTLHFAERFRCAVWGIKDNLAHDEKHYEYPRFGR